MHPRPDASEVHFLLYRSLPKGLQVSCMKTRKNKEITAKNKTGKAAANKKGIRDLAPRKDPKGRGYPYYYGGGGGSQGGGG